GSHTPVTRGGAKSALPLRASFSYLSHTAKGIAVNISRRKAMGLLAGGAMAGALRLSTAAAVDGGGQRPAPARVRTHTLDNGLRMHILASGSRYISAALVLRSRQIDAREGLAHILEHTSFTGAAGRYSPRQIGEMHDDYLQNSGASTEAGMITWQAS